MQRPWEGQGLLETGRGSGYNVVIRGRVKSEEAGQAGNPLTLQGLISI